MRTIEHLDRHIEQMKQREQEFMDLHRADKIDESMFTIERFIKMMEKLQQRNED